MTLSKSGLTGAKLREAIHAAPTERKPLIEGLLYENSVLMTSADPGLGKSTTMINAIAQMSCGLPVFGVLQVPHPLRCYYIPWERGAQEAMERLRHMEEVIPINYENIVIKDQFICLDVTNAHHEKEIVATMKSDTAHWPKIDLSAQDPIYASVRGGLSGDEKASMFTRFSSKLMQEFKCANWFNHHNVKQSYSQDGSPIIKDDPFYGSIWLKAHCTGAYFMKKSDIGTTLINKKDSHGNLLSEIQLEFDADTYLSRAKNINEVGLIRDRAMTFCRASFHAKNAFTFKQFFGALGGCLQGVSTSYARRLLCTPPFNTILKKHKSNGGATLYEVTKAL